MNVELLGDGVGQGGDLGVEAVQHGDEREGDGSVGVGVGAGGAAGAASSRWCSR